MEIGSEYWEFEEELNSDNKLFWDIGQDVRFTLSGRTSIHYVLKNILLKRNVQRVYMPSYSCSSMIQPFEELGIEVEYYDVYYNEGLKYNIDLNENCDIFFAMNYFGYSKTNMEEYIKKFKAKGKIVIEDITHSIFSDKRYSIYSDYVVGSLRKWFPISSGAIAACMNSNFELDLRNDSNEELINLKNKAMQNKKVYIDSKKGSKEEFLNQYAESNHILSENYKYYSIDSKSYEIIMGMDLEKIKNQRKENTKVIYEKLKNNMNIRFLVENYNEDDCLLFVPILLKHKIRNELRNYLISKNVFLPVHWPLDERINNIFDKELSLVCDQRYSEKQIESYIDLIIDYFENQ